MSKLVRDLIPDIIPEDKKGNYKFTVVEDEEFGRLIKEKLVEEINEYLEAENLEELADVLEVLEAIMKHKNFNPTELDGVKQSKKEKRGGFEKKILMEVVR